MTLLHSLEFVTFGKYNFTLYFCASLKTVYFVHKHIREQQAYSFILLNSYEFRCTEGEFPYLRRVAFHRHQYI